MRSPEFSRRPNRRSSRRVDGSAQSGRGIGQGDPERRVPLPEAFGVVFGFWLKDQSRGAFAFVRAPGQKPVSSQVARAYRRGMLKQAGIDQKISSHKLRHTYATNLLNAGAERADRQALPGQATLTTPPMDTRVGQERRAAMVARL